ncbi:type VII secretion-associated serine protease mycosin [Plantactinospora sp. KBS50]|nr:type VII secretion-associated serine protease mycosin [Plantactinospora sp. KBS50]ASW58056.1 type VII secretion-associated serine protease mycosin [Plantactinospora sp. KBS50]
MTAAALLGGPTAPASATPGALPGPGSALTTPAPAFADTRHQPPGFSLLGDPVREDQWQLKELDARHAWQFSTGKGVTVAVIDSGVDGRHPDLSGQVLPGIDLVSGSGDGQLDPVGHGTTVAGLIAGRRDDDRGVLGLAPDAHILPVRVLDDENRYDDALIVARGVRWAVDNGAKVINLSLGGNGDSPALAAAIDYAFARDVVVVACTGNLTPSSPVNRVWYPAREPGVLAVSGLDRDTDGLWSGSIDGAETVLSAPASGLVGARPNGYWSVQGTSFAAPLVSATAALLRSRWPTMSAGDVVNRLIATARDLGTPGRDDQFGFGRVDPVAALTATVPRVSWNPLDDHRSPGTAGFGHAPGSMPPASPGPSAQQLDVGASDLPRWSARAAGQPAEQESHPGWGWLLLVVVFGTGGIVALIRRQRTRS